MVTKSKRRFLPDSSIKRSLLSFMRYGWPRTYNREELKDAVVYKYLGKQRDFTADRVFKVITALVSSGSIALDDAGHYRLSRKPVAK